MSHAYYNEIWLITRSDLEKLLELERKLQEGPIKKKNIFNTLLPIYVRYRNIVRRLVICYDQMVQTQKRELIKRILDCAIARMLEYKKEIVRLDFTDYQWPDNILYQMKFTPDDIELLATVSGRERLEERRKFIRELIESADKVPQTKEISLSEMDIESTTDLEDDTLKTRAPRRRLRALPPSKVELIRESPEEKAAREAKFAAEKAMINAILLIQSHERARIGRCHGADAKRVYDYNKKLAMGEIEPRKIDRAKYIKSAVTIQRAWRRYAARKATRRRIARLEETLDMTIPSWRCREILTKDEGNFRGRRDLMPLLAARTKKAIDDERTRLLRIRGPGLMEDITDEIHEWFVVWYDSIGHYDIFPAAELGGSVLIATGQTLTPQEYLMEKLEKEKQAKAKGRRAKEVPVPKPAPIKQEVAGWRMPQTQALSFLEEANVDFIRDWSLRDESVNPEQKEYLDLITEKLCYELQLEMREIVDELMRVELELLNKALLKDHARDKKFVIPTMGKDIKKEDIKPKAKAKKREEDTLEDVAVEELFNELVQAKIIRNYPTVFLRDWVGDLSYQNYEARRESRNYKHRLGDIKQLVLEYCVLPLISKEVHQIAPLVRSVCICGLPGAGKTFLANAICSEVGALLFDVSAPVLLNQYVGKKNQQKLMGIISKVARVYAPSIILLDGGEKPWLKTVLPQERYLQPKRFARNFVKLVKNIEPGDQILFLSLSAEPQRGKAAFVRLHNKFIILPTTDYNTLYMYYKDLLTKYHGVDRDIDVSCLAKMSVGIPLDFIRQSVEKVLSLRRRITLKFNPLSPMEIMDEVMTYPYPTAETLEAFNKFEKRTPLARRKVEKEAKKEEEEEEEED